MQLRQSESYPPDISYQKSVIEETYVRQSPYFDIQTVSTRIQHCSVF